MSTQQHDSALLGAYALGALDEGEIREVDGHVAECEECRVELDALRELKGALGEVPPEAFLDGPPEGGDLMLRRTLRAVAEERTRSDIRRRGALAAAAVVTTVSLLGAGFLLGGAAERNDAVQPPPRPTVTASGPVPAPVPGVRVASVTDSGTGARMAVRVTPASDWVRVNAAVSGIPAGELCRLIVVADDGTREIAGSWHVGSAEKGANLDGSAAVPADRVKEILVENAEGKRYVTAGIA
ncbi:zf-HC2 domain-containing protein [Streptomyces sp. NPDC093252]|uniref:anti-sigma factor family protein n=1 Tax=Streptomyces sp. NPDC093252 TaxID=3154980 RepID=UPI003423077C